MSQNPERRKVIKAAGGERHWALALRTPAEKDRETIFRGGTITTMVDDSREVCGRSRIRSAILPAGDVQTVMALASDDTKIIELDGAVLASLVYRCSWALHECFADREMGQCFGQTCGPGHFHCGYNRGAAGTYG